MPATDTTRPPLTGYAVIGECIRRLRALGFDNAAIAFLLRDAAGALEKVPRYNSPSASAVR